MEGEGQRAFLGTMSQNERLRLYAAIVIAVAVIAVVSVVLAPHGSLLSRCLSTPISGNKYSCIETLALATGNSTMCGMLPNNTADNCYATLAHNQSNASLCGRISNQGSSSSCFVSLALSTDNYALCSQASAAYRDDCLLQLAGKDLSSAVCDGISNATKRMECGSSVNLSGALKYGNSSYCQTVSPSTNYTISSSIISDAETFSRVNASLSSVIDYYALANLSMSARDFCYTSVAYQHGNYSYCSGIGNSTVKGICAALANSTTVSRALNYTELNYTALIYQCYNTTGDYQTCNSTYLTLKALRSRNLTICSTLPTNYSNNCYSSLAQEYNDSAYCSYIKNGTVSSACYANFKYYNITG
ncbi:MAG: hypothetical protein KGI00_00115 [Candidatus Micrarchaeota archaeon]|nr:hypothetical protein [Candidatus Micrarchaeota archaeon]MDE1849121.1 hypothetical protein [Candidatus Micrarchaeota archaeon]